jgi:chaperonin GroES
MNTQDIEMEQQPQKSMAAMLDAINIAEQLDDDLINKIGDEVVTGFNYDLDSRKDWETQLDSWTKLAKQIIEPKSFPWKGASNVKYPLLSTAAMQFAARAYPALVPSDGRVVKAKPIGKDPTGEKSTIAEAVSIYMSNQLLVEMDGWEEDMDKLLIMLPIVGTMFKKTYWDGLTKKNCSHLVLPKNLVVNYWAKSLKDAERVTEILELSARRIKEKQQAGIWLDIDLGSAPIPGRAENPPMVDATTPFTILEQHTFLDLDDDGYKEPYIVTVHLESKRVLRIAARFDEDTIDMDDEGNLRKITPIQYYTKFGFVPNPDGSFYDIGFGLLLGPLNESVNTLINQLVDAGSLANMQAGFLGKGLRLRNGDTKFSLGEWKQVNATGDDLRKQIVPLPSKEPSMVLFNLMGSLITSGKELASVAEIFVGKTPGQNTPATTTMATIEQGMKVFTAVYKRLYRAMSEEFSKLARLNYIYVDPETIIDVIDMSINPEDFDTTKNNIYPGADPTAVSQTEKLLKAQGLLELLPTGMLNPVEVVKRVLEAQEQPNWEKVLNQQVAETGQQPEPPPDPKLMEMQMKGQMETQKLQMQSQMAQQKMEMESRDKEVQLAMKQQEHALDMEHKAKMANLSIAEATHKQRIFSTQGQADLIQKLTHREAEHSQKMRQRAEQVKQPPKGAPKK